MTKEELEKEATEYAQKLGVKDFIAKPKEIVAYFGYLAGAEPREKRIAELEQKLEQTEKDLADYQFNYPTIKELQKENAELKIKVIALENANRAMVKELDDTTSGGLSVLENVVRSKEQLSNAKELLNEFKRVLKEHNLYRNDLCTRAEQFLSEVEK